MVSNQHKGITWGNFTLITVQLFISPDTRRLDADLVRPSIQELDVPEQAEYMLTFKRGSAAMRFDSRSSENTLRIRLLFRSRWLLHTYCFPLL